MACREWAKTNGEFRRNIYHRKYYTVPHAVQCTVVAHGGTLAARERGREGIRCDVYLEGWHQFGQSTVATAVCNSETVPHHDVHVSTVVVIKSGQCRTAARCNMTASVSLVPHVAYSFTRLSSYDPIPRSLGSDRASHISRINVSMS